METPVYKQKLRSRKRTFEASTKQKVVNLFKTNKFTKTDIQNLAIIFDVHRKDVRVNSKKKKVFIRKGGKEICVAKNREQFNALKKDLLGSYRQMEQESRRKDE